MKESRRKLVLTPSDATPILHISKRARLFDHTTPLHRCISPVRAQVLHTNTTPQRWKLDKDDDIHYCEEVQLCSWLSIHRHHALRCDTQHPCITRPLDLHYVPSPTPVQLTDPVSFVDFIHKTYHRTIYHAIDYAIPFYYHNQAYMLPFSLIRIQSHNYVPRLRLSSVLSRSRAVNLS